MTEEQWVSCTDPEPMLEYLHTSDKASDRKLRLFAVACCRRVWPQLRDERFRWAVEVAERFADGKAKHEERNDAMKVAWAAWTAPAEAAASDAIGTEAIGAAWEAARHAAWAVGSSPRAKEREAQSALLRCILGPLSFRLVVIEPSLLRWNDSTIPRLAQLIYDERCFCDLPVLADALEEAGCTDRDILSHCRNAGEHVRGCWVVDLLLGKT